MGWSLLGTLRSAGDFQQVEGALLYRSGRGDHPTGFLAHLDRVQSHGPEVLQKSLETVHWQPVGGALAVCRVPRNGGSVARAPQWRCVAPRQRPGRRRRTTSEPALGACATPHNRPACRGTRGRRRVPPGDGGRAGSSGPRSSNCETPARPWLTLCSGGPLVRRTPTPLARWCG